MPPSLGRVNDLGFVAPIGGGTIPPDIIDRLLTFGGGPRARVVILPTASSDPAESGERSAALFARPGVDVHVAGLLTCEHSSDPAVLDALEQATMVFFTGGHQARITAAVAGTPAHELLRRRLAGDLLLAGTSAGAVVMGEVMPSDGTGWGALLKGEAIPSDAGGEDPGKGAVDERRRPILLLPGLGFLPGVAVDQHFNARGRMGRLLYTITKHRRQGLVGLGLDESTAALIQLKTGLMEVVGEGTVFVVRAAAEGHDNLAARNAGPGVSAGSPGALATFGLSLDVLPTGYGYDLAGRRPLAPREAGLQRAAAGDQD